MYFHLIFQQQILLKHLLKNVRHFYPALCSELLLYFILYSLYEYFPIFYLNIDFQRLHSGIDARLVQQIVRYPETCVLLSGEKLSSIVLEVGEKSTIELFCKHRLASHDIVPGSENSCTIRSTETCVRYWNKTLTHDFTHLIGTSMTVRLISEF